jgi:hypothetical protein
MELQQSTETKRGETQKIISASLQTSVSEEIPYVARAFNPAHAGLARSAGVPAQLAARTEKSH